MEYNNLQITINNQCLFEISVKYLTETWSSDVNSYQKRPREETKIIHGNNTKNILVDMMGKDQSELTFSIPHAKKNRVITITNQNQLTIQETETHILINSINNTLAEFTKVNTSETPPE